MSNLDICVNDTKPYANILNLQNILLGSSFSINQWQETVKTTRTQ